MNFRSIAAAFLISLWTCSFAFRADAQDAPGSGLMFPESVERAMIGEGLQMQRQNRSFFETSKSQGRIDSIDSISVVISGAKNHGRTQILTNYH